MKTIIIYASNHGTTESIANYIKESIKNIGKLCPAMFNVKTDKNISLSKYDYIIIGGSFHAGNLQTKLKKFIKTNEDELLRKKIAFYFCGMNESEIENQVKSSVSDIIIKHAKSCKTPGGEFLFHKMNFIEKSIIKKITKVNTSISKIDYSKIDELINDLYIQSSDKDTTTTNIRYACLDNK